MSGAHGGDGCGEAREARVEMRGLKKQTIGDFRGRLERLSVAEAAALMGVRETAVRLWIRSYGMPATVYGGVLAVKWSDALRWYVSSLACRPALGLKRPVCKECGHLG